MHDLANPLSGILASLYRRGERGGACFWFRLKLVEQALGPQSAP